MNHLLRLAALRLDHDLAHGHTPSRAKLHALARLLGELADDADALVGMVSALDVRAPGPEMVYVAGWAK